MDNFGLYLIMTRPAVGHAAFARIAVETGVSMLQLREKDLPDGKLLDIAREIRRITRGTSTRFIVNDRPDIALLCEADGVHVGQDDLPVEEVRRMLGPEKIVGLSTHSFGQVRDAMAKPAGIIDYIGFGPLWATPTKAIPDPAVGTDQLREILAKVSVPVVAIGGIFPENLSEVLAAGARNPCLVRHFMEPDDPGELSRRIREIQRMIG